MQSQPLTDRHTVADLWSDLYEAWTRSLFSPWKLADTSEDRKEAELAPLAPLGPGVLRMAGGLGLLGRCLAAHGPVLGCAPATQ
jgi:hypothetical protein